MKADKKEMIRRVESAISDGALDLAYIRLDKKTILSIVKERRKELLSLKELTVDSSIVESIDDFFNFNTLEKLYIDFLNFTGENLKIPESILKSSCPKYFEFWSEFYLPEWILNANNLVDLFCHNLKQIPEWIGKIDSLKALKLHSETKTLPDSIGDLCNLAELNLSLNEMLESIPKTIGKLSTLKSLRLNSTNIKQLPETIGNLSALKRLDLKDTPVSALPKSFFNLPSLEYLDLRNTWLKELPEDMTKIKTLRTLDLRGLPIGKQGIPTGMPSDIQVHISRDCTGIPDYLPLFYEDYVVTYLKVVKMACDLSTKARREGLMALEDAVDNFHKDDFFRIGLQPVVSGTDADIICDILSKIIEHETDHYRKILKNMIMEAVLSIQAGDNTLRIILNLNSMANIKDDPVTDAITDSFINSDKNALETLPEKISRINTHEREKTEDTEIIRFIKRAIMICRAIREKRHLNIENLVVWEKGRLDIFEYGISMFIDQYDFELVERILDNLVNHEIEPAMKTLALMKKEAVLSIMAGDWQRLLLMKLVALYKGNFEGMAELFVD